MQPMRMKPNSYYGHPILTNLVIRVLQTLTNVIVQFSPVTLTGLICITRSIKRTKKIAIGLYPVKCCGDMCYCIMMSLFIALYALWCWGTLEQCCKAQNFWWLLGPWLHKNGHMWLHKAYLRCWKYTTRKYTNTKNQR